MTFPFDVRFAMFATVFVTACTQAQESDEDASSSQMDSGTPAEAAECVHLGEDWPEDPRLFFNFTVLNDDFDGCGEEGTGRRDKAFFWRPPETGRYVFTARGYEGISHVLYALDGQCSGQELSCADSNVQLEDGSWSRFSMWLPAGTPITLVLDERLAHIPAPEDDPSAVLDIEKVECPVRGLSSTTSTQDSQRFSGIASPVGPASCAPNDKLAPAETSWGFQAPEAGRYRFELTERWDQPVALAAFDSACLKERACAFSEDASLSGLELDLAVGDAVALIASAGTTGDTDYEVTLSVERIAEWP